MAAVFPVPVEERPPTIVHEGGIESLAAETSGHFYRKPAEARRRPPHDACVSTTIAKPPKRMRIASGAVLIPNSGYEAWHARASTTPGLNDVQRKVLGAIAMVATLEYMSAPAAGRALRHVAVAEPPHRVH